jgi:hypothetical protein
MRVDIRKAEGPKCKMPEIGFSRNYFTEEKSVDSVHEPWTTSGLGPQWTGMDGGTELVGARPSGAPVSKGAGQGAEEEEWDTRNSFRASPEGGRRQGGRASRRRGGGRGAQWGVCSGVGEEERRAW